MFNSKTTAWVPACIAFVVLEAIVAFITVALSGGEGTAGLTIGFLGGGAALLLSIVVVITGYTDDGLVHGPNEQAALIENETG